MTFPTGIIRREVTFGVPFALADGDDLVMAVTFTPSRSMVWGALGFPGIAREYRIENSPSLQGSVFLPVTDQAGWLDGAGNALSVAGGAQTHVYSVAIRFRDTSGTFIADAPLRNITLPTGDLSPVDLDTLLPVTTVGGVTVSIPDQWSQLIQQAQQAAAAATSQPVGGFLSGNMPNPGVNQTALSNAMLARAPIYWQPNTLYTVGTQVIAPTDGSVVRRTVTGTSGAVYDASAWTIVLPSAASLAATYVALRGPWVAGTAFPKNSLVIQAGAVYLAAADVPARTTFTAADWQALGGAAVAAITTVLNGDGTFTSTGSGVTDNGDGTVTYLDSSVTDNGDGTFTLAA